MGACCFKPSINEEAAGAVSGGAAAGSSSRQRAGNGVRAGRGVPSDGTTRAELARCGPPLLLLCALQPAARSG